MVSGGSGADGGAHNLSARVRKTIQSIKEIVGNHSDADIYATLKETNMDPNETTQKLLNQDPFHEVKRKRDKKKESTGYKVSSESRKHAETIGERTRSYSSWDRNVQRGGYAWKILPGISREFRIVRDNRVNQNTNGDTKPTSSQCSASASDQVLSNFPEKSSLGVPDDQKNTNSELKMSNGHCDSASGHARDADSNGIRRQVSLEDTRTTVLKTTLRVQEQNPHTSQQYSATLISNNSVIGVYASSSDPVHVPSPDSRSSGTVGAIKREVGVVGVRRLTSEHSATQSSAPSSSFSIPLLEKGISASESFGHSPSITKGDQFNQTPVSGLAMPGMSIGRPFIGNQYNNKLHQPLVGNQKALQPNMEWKPKLSQKSSHISSGVSKAAAAAPISSPADNSTSSQMEAASLPENLSQLNFSENHVIIPQHLRVPEADRTGLTFGSFGAELNSAKDLKSGFQTYGVAEETKEELTIRASVSTAVASNEDAARGNQVDLIEDHSRTSRSNSPASSVASEHPLPDNKVPSSPQNMENHVDIGLFRSHSPSYCPEEPQEQQEPPGMGSFPAYDPQADYHVPFFRQAMDENIRGQGASPQEALISHVASNVPPSTPSMIQQQPVAQLYPQVHISHYPNYMPYRQFLSPLYVPPMAVANYSNNPTYPPHPSNGSSYLLMPGGSSHLAGGGLKFASSQYKPVAAVGPTSYGNYSNPSGYAISPPGTVASGTGLEDAARIKYKDGNLYVPNPQADTSEIWVQTHSRDISGLQSAPYYNLTGQAAPHAAAYMPFHTGHASFNSAAQSTTHMQFPGLYHGPQPTAIASPHHHLVHQQLSGMGGNVGVGVTGPGAQVGTYQQPQLGHINWTSNF